MQKGRASIPLSGIDVPFHSRLLLPGVPTFKRVLQETLASVRFKPSDLVGKYIPNLLGAPFALTRQFASDVLMATANSSEVLKSLLTDPRTADETSWSGLYSDPEQQEWLCSVLVIELLAYQFASPVQWIPTQEYLLSNGFRRFVELGPSPVLLPMLTRTYGQEMGELAVGDLQMLWSGRDMDTILCKDEGVKEDAADDDDASPKAAAREPVPPPVIVRSAAPVMITPAPVVTAAPAPAMISSSGGGGGANTAQVPFSALHSLRVIVSQKLKMPFGEVAPAKSIRALSGGKSALQNEILGDLQAEFATNPEGADEAALADLGSKLGGAGKYTKPGKILSGLVSRTLQLVLPGGLGMNQVREYLRSVWGLDEASSDGVLVHALTMKQAARLDSEGAVPVSYTHLTLPTNREV